MLVTEWLGKENELGQQIWKDKYQFEDETFEEWLDRVSNGNSMIRKLILNKRFLFGGRILANRGLNKLGRKVTYSNCYVLEQVPDSIEGIYETAKLLARTFSYGGGVGIDISNLRPKGSPVNNAAKTTSGAVSFMDTFSGVSSVIGQQGRRGALMISMDCNHPDIQDFIDAKKNTDKLEGCNISVRVDDEFMSQVHELDTLQHELFMRLAENNWDYAEPGILYWDAIKYYNLLSEYVKTGEFEFAGVNPCAEEPLPAGGSCLLGAMNLAEYVEEPFTDKAVFNLAQFKQDVAVCVGALNEVLDEGLELHPLEIQRKCVKEWRQIGLGIMGFGTMLIKMRVQYGSERCLKLIQQIGQAMVNAGLLESSRIAKDLGAFDKFDADKILKSYFIENLPIDEKVLDSIKQHGLRNSQLFTIAPTGSISTMLQVTGGVEPMFNYKFWRKTKSLNGGEETYYEVVDPIVVEAMRHEENKDDIPDYVVWANILNPENRILTQAQWQRYIDASISSTVNLNNEVTVDEVAKLYHQAWVTGCKGLTIFRDGCARIPILSAEKTEETVEESNELKRGEWAEIPEDTMYHKRKIHTGCGQVNLFIGYSPSEDRIVELFVKRSGQGGCEHNIDATVIAMSGMLRLGGNLDNIKKAFEGCATCSSFTRAKCQGKKLSPGKSCPTAILNAVLAFKDEAKPVSPQFTPIELTKPVEKSQCPVCKAELANTGGCNVCPSCGWSKCD